MKRFESVYVPIVRKSVESQLNEAIRVYLRGGVSALRTYAMSTDSIIRAVQSIYENVGAFYARKTRRDILASVEQKAFGIDQEWIDRIIEYLLQNILVRSRSIVETTKQQVLAAIIEGEQKGWGVDKIVSNIRNTNLPEWRSRLIVRTELQLAMHAGQKISEEESEWETVSEWIAARDHRTRHGHRDTDGKIVKEGEVFQVPRYRKNVIIGYDRMTGPGDPNAHADNICNCRCTKAVTAARDKNGRLIRKRKISVILPDAFRRQGQIVTV